VTIFDRHNQAMAGISVSTPTLHFDEARASEVVTLLQNASRLISKQPGCTACPITAPEPAPR
jgi:IclR family KDG regulon transcriptional repressor